MINILIIDDSETETAILKTILEKESDMKVIGCAKNGKEGAELVARLKPDLITMDIMMPIMDGFEATKKIMAETPTPIIVISSKANDEIMQTSFRALEAGALSVIDKPINVFSPQFEATRKNVVETIRTMAGIRVARRSSTGKKNLLKKSSNTLKTYEIVAIGASVGGTQALKTIFSRLPINFPIPIVVVQHMTKGFITGFAKWLNDELPINVKEAEDMELLQGGTIYFAPDDYHLKVIKEGYKLQAKLVKGAPVSGFCPSITALFESVANTSGKLSLGILLTGMGSDGAKGLLEIKRSQGHTVIQDKESAVVFGMGSVAEAMGAVDKVVELDKIADYLKKLLHVKEV